jgi:hypothetical protein
MILTGLSNLAVSNDKGRRGMRMKYCLIAAIALFAVGVLASLSYAEIDPETAVGAWLFEEGAGTVADDSSGNGNDGTIEGDPSWVNGRFGKALDFDGTDDQIIVPDSESLKLAHLTMAAWVNLRSYPDDARIITQEVDGSPFSSYSLMMSGDGESKLEFRIALDNSRKRVPSNADIPLNEWTHVAATYDGANAVIYINGEIDKTEPQSGVLLTTDNPVYIGGSQFWVPRFFDGLMDDAALFNVGLSQDDIRSLMNNGLADEIAAPSVVSSAGKLATTWAQIKR